MITLENVTKSYDRGATRAVDSLSLTIPPGEIFGFLGPNGAGKSTTINMLVGLLRPDSGRISVGGYSFEHDMLKIKQIIGYVPDGPLFYEKMTGRSYLEFICDIYKVSPEDRKRRTESLSQEFLLSDALGDVISSYSHGMKQKLAIIAALVHDPEIFILDEPLVGLDPKAAFVLKEKMRQLCSRGKGVFFSTHVMEVAEKICDRVGIIRKGSLIACAPFDELRASRGGADESLETVFLELTDEDDTQTH